MGNKWGIGISTLSNTAAGVEELIEHIMWSAAYAVADSEPQHVPDALATPNGMIIMYLLSKHGSGNVCGVTLEHPIPSEVLKVIIEYGLELPKLGAEVEVSFSSIIDSFLSVREEVNLTLNTTELLGDLYACSVGVRTYVDTQVPTDLTSLASETTVTNEAVVNEAEEYHKALNDMLDAPISVSTVPDTGIPAVDRGYAHWLGYAAIGAVIGVGAYYGYQHFFGNGESEDVVVVDLDNAF